MAIGNSSRECSIPDIACQHKFWQTYLSKSYLRTSVCNLNIRLLAEGFTSVSSLTISKYSYFPSIYPSIVIPELPWNLDGCSWVTSTNIRVMRFIFSTNNWQPMKRWPQCNHPDFKIFILVLLYDYRSNKKSLNVNKTQTTFSFFPTLLLKNIEYVKPKLA